MTIKTLRSRIPHLLTAVLLLLGLMTAATTQAQAASQQLTGSATICSNSPIPAGWVVTSSYSSSNCPGTGYAYSITDTTGISYATVCSFSPIPAGWVVTSSYSTSNCPGTGYAYSIASTTGISYATVCSFSPIPAGWVVTSSYSTSNCPGTGYAYSIA
ncbi:hypothetical protein ACIQ9P_38965, partial [Kitasatospora sp. NPDC094019]|uniref:hypothetical protein n=1 Tax=Kitasatospora sp. NPDC094019 TaxID=3364091 RepID=UPI00381D1F22